MGRWGNLTSSFFYKEMPNVGTSQKIPTYLPKSMSTYQMKNILVSNFFSGSIIHTQHFIKVFLKMGRGENLIFGFFYKEMSNVGTGIKNPLIDQVNEYLSDQKYFGI